MHWTNVCYKFKKQNPGRVLTKFLSFRATFQGSVTSNDSIQHHQWVPKMRCASVDPAAVKPSTTSPGVVQNSNDEESGDKGEDEISGQNQQESIAFSHRFDKEFDISYPRHHDWLRINHPQSNHSLYPNF